MQAENQTNSDFLDRTNRLAVRLNLNCSQLPEVLGISKAMFFAYRKRGPISGKAWEKLRVAEAAAGIPPTNRTVAEPVVLREDPVPYRTKSDLVMDFGASGKTTKAMSQMAAAIAEVHDSAKGGSISAPEPSMMDRLISIEASQAELSRKLDRVLSLMISQHPTEKR